MLFPKTQDYLAPVQMNAALGGSCRFEITRELPIEAMLLVLTVTVATGAATPVADGLLGLVKNIQLNAPDGARNRQVLNASGPALIEYGYHLTGCIERNTRGQVNYSNAASAVPVAAATYKICVPIYFCPPNMADPVASAFLLPVDRYNANPMLDVQFGSQADLDINATPTLAITAATFTAKLIVVRRRINRINWPIVDAELIESTAVHTATNAAAEKELPLGGYLTGLLLRTKLRTSTPTEIKGDISAGGAWALLVNQNTIIRATLQDIEMLNDHSTSFAAVFRENSSLASVSVNSRGVLTGAYFLDFISDRPGADAGDAQIGLRSVLNLNVPTDQGVRCYLRQDISLAGNPIGTAASITIGYLAHRFYGNLDAIQAK